MPRAKHEALTIHEDDIKRIAHAKRVHGRAANKQQGHRTSVAGARAQKSPQLSPEALHHQRTHAPPAPASAHRELDPRPSLAGVGLAPHETTAARYLSTTTLLSCRAMAGSSKPTPAIWTDDGQGL